jgi:hypothetical protein
LLAVLGAARDLLNSLAALVALTSLALAAPALAQAPFPGQYARAEGNRRHLIELRADGSASATTTAADGTTLVATRFEWRMQGDRLLQSRVRLRDRNGQFNATRDDVLLELRNVSAKGFDTRARADLPWFSWRRQDAAK